MRSFFLALVALCECVAGTLVVGYPQSSTVMPWCAS